MPYVLCYLMFGWILTIGFICFAVCTYRENTRFLFGQQNISPKNLISGKEQRLSDFLLFLSFQLIEPSDWARSCSCVYINKKASLFISIMIFDSLENIRLRRERSLWDKRPFWSLVAWSSCCIQIFKIAFSTLLIRNNDPFFASSSLPGSASPEAAARLLLYGDGRRGCDGRRRVLRRTAEWEGLEGLLSTWWTSLTSRSAGPACQQWRKLRKPSIWEGSTSRTLSRRRNSTKFRSSEGFEDQAG